MFGESKIKIFQERVALLCEAGARDTGQTLATIEAQQAKDHAFGNSRAVFPRLEALELGARQLTKAVLDQAGEYRLNLHLPTNRLADEAEAQLRQAIAAMRERSRIEPHPGSWDKGPIAPAVTERLEALEPEMLFAVREFRAGATRSEREGPSPRMRDKAWKLAKWLFADWLRALILFGIGAGVAALLGIG